MFGNQSSSVSSVDFTVRCRYNYSGWQVAQRQRVLSSEDYVVSTSLYTRSPTPEIHWPRIQGVILSGKDQYRNVQKC